MIGRPHTSEAAPYYFTYIDRVNGADLMPVLKGQLDETLALCARISEDQSLYRYAADKWSIRQVFSHLTDAERVFAFRAFWIARSFDSPLPSFDQNVSAAAVGADRIPWAAHVEEFRRVRLSSISLFENMPADAWMRTGIASDNSFTVRALAYIVAGHLAHHIAVLQEKYLLEI